MPYDEPIDPSGYKDLLLLDSAVNRPFQTFDGIELYQGLDKKAAALFHSLVCNHCFSNGNKRTGLIALDLFLTSNDRLLLMSNDDAYMLAKRTAEANADGRNAAEALSEITETISTQSVTWEWLKSDAAKQIPNIDRLNDTFPRFRELIRAHRFNAQD